MILISSLSTSTFAQFVLTRLSCDDLRVEWQGPPLPFVGFDIALATGTFSCQGDPVPRTIGQGTIHRFSYHLQRLQNGSFQTVSTSKTNATFSEFHNLSDGTYRVTIGINGIEDVNVYPMNTPCFAQPLGKKHNPSNFSSAISNTLEVGENTVDVGFILADANANNIFCQDDIIAAGGIFMLTDLNPLGPDLTTGETDYRVDLCKLNPLTGGCDIWTSTYWQAGEAPASINLLTDVWTLHHSTWTFWRGDYKVTLAVQQDNCVSYESASSTFTVVEPGGNCRKGIIKNLFDISIYPNPSSDRIHLTGVPQNQVATPYQILDISGKPVSTGSLTTYDSFIDISLLQPGIYIIRMEMEGNIVSERFVVAR
ncbi:MAG: T9SS type A sorting domain-containing protein [Chitinophagales bacterium]|nr:T9SS type A sorting domain-containing protein [Chitinophagales bacterium]